MKQQFESERLEGGEQGCTHYQCAYEASGIATQNPTIVLYSRNHCLDFSQCLIESIIFAL